MTSWLTGHIFFFTSYCEGSSSCSLDGVACARTEDAHICRRYRLHATYVIISRLVIDVPVYVFLVVIHSIVALHTDA